MAQSKGQEREVMERFKIGIFMVLLVWFSGFAFAQRLNIKHYSSKDGLPQDQVLAIGQDAQGFLWAGSYVGLSRFNGRQWTSYTTRNGLNRNTISAIGDDGEGRLLVGMQTGGLNLIEHGKVDKYLAKNWSELDIEEIYKTRDGTVWVASREGILRIKGKEVRLFSMADGLPHGHCQTLWEQGDGSLLVGSREGLAIIRGDQVEIGPAALEYMNIQVILGHEDGRIFLGTDKGLHLLNGEPALPGMNEDLNIQCGAAGRDGSLWFGTTSKGVLYIKGEEWGYLDRKSGLPQNHILALFVDDANNLWVGSDDGLSRLTASPFMSYTTDHGLVHNFVRALFIDSEERLWIGTREGVCYMTPSGEVEILDTSQFLNDRIYAITEHPDGSLLFAASEGLVSYKDGVVRNYRASDNLALSRLHSVYTDPWDRVWLGADGLMEFVNGEPQSFTTGHPLSEIKIIDMVRDKDGWLWLAAFKGLYSYHPDRVEVRKHEAFDLTIWDLDLDQNGNLVFGTNGMGLYRYDGTEFTNISTSDGLGNDFVWQVLGASNGDLWVGHTNGLDRIQGDQFSHFDKNDGMAENEGSSATCIEDKNGGLWFGSAQGLTYYHASLVPKERPLPKVHLEKILANDVERPIIQGASFPRTRNTLSFHYAGLSFGDEDRIQFSYRLDGLENEWCKPTRAVEAMYRSLPRGDYRFLLKARVGDGPWNEETEAYGFSIQPYYWETLWFKILLGVLLVALVLAFIQWKNMALKKKNILLSKLIDKKTSDLRLKNEDLKISEERSRAMFEQADVSIVLFEQETGKFEEFNDQAHQSLGYTREEFEKLRVHDVQGFQDQDRFQDYLKMIMETESKNIETQHFRKEGQARDIVMRSRAIEIHGVAYVLGIWRDVTDRKNVQNQLMIAEKMASLGRLTAGIAHEMNTPLAAVRTSLVEMEGLVEEYEASIGNPEVNDDDHREIATEMKQAVEIAKKAATRAAGFVQSTKSQTRNLEGRKNRLFNVDTVIKESLLLLSHALRAGKSVMNYTCDDQDHEIYGAPGWLSQVVTNLVTNAIDANEDKGGGNIFVSLKKENQQLELRISDEGSGIQPDKLQRIFDPMFTTKDIGKGTGLGLTIVHDIITGQLGGTISVESEPGVGATFIMQFPIKKEATVGSNI